MKQTTTATTKRVIDQLNLGPYAKHELKKNKYLTPTDLC